MTRVIAVTGGKGGVGKTNISLNLALVLAELGHRVCLFDADLGLANINVLLGIYPEYDLEDVILHGKNLSEILIKNYEGIDIIPGSSGVERLANLTQAEIDRIVQSFETLNSYEYFILDTSAGISRSVISFCLAATDVALVITPEPTSLTDAYALLKVLCFNGFQGKPKIIVNQCKNTSIASATYNKLKEVVHKYLTLDIVPLGIIVRDKKFPEAVQRQRPLVRLYPNSSAAKCLQVIASRILANKPEPFSSTGIAGFWARFLSIARTPLKIPERPEANEAETEREREKQELDRTPFAFPAAPEEAVRQETAHAETEASRTADSGTARGAMPEIRANKNSMLERIEHRMQLPTLPHILIRVVEACGNDATDMRQIADIIEKDPALCTRILRVVNSSYYGLTHKINSFDQALSLLGIDTIRNIAISASVYQVFNGMQDTDSFNLKAFWWHSLGCAVTANLIAKHISYTRPDEAFLAGLLHDIGKVLVASCLKDNAGVGTSLQDAEGREFPEHHELGAWLVRRWNLQSLLGDAILYHHEPLDRIMHALPLVKIVYVANLLSTTPSGADEYSKETAAKIFGLDSGIIDDLVIRAAEQVRDIAKSLEIAIPESAGQSEKQKQIEYTVSAHLTRKIRDLSLLQGTLQQFINAPDIDALLRNAYDCLAVLLNISSTQVRIFVYAADQQILVGSAPHTPLVQDQVNELTIPTSIRTSLVSTALSEKRSIDSFSYAGHTTLTIIDEQLIRILGKQGMVCFPLFAHGTPVGAAVIGVDRDDMEMFRVDTNLLNLFFGQLALALEAEAIRQRQTKKILAERLAASSAIARKVAHEVNNPLSIIKNYLKILEIKLADHALPVDELSIINEEINRVAGIVESLSDFSRPKIQTLAPVYINTLLEDIVKITRPSLAQQHIFLTLTQDTTVPPIISDKNGLKQVFINLIKNAAEALVDGGTIALATRYIPEQSSVEITVADNGPGLPEAVKKRLFEPYISTKGRNHAGLGLSIVYSTVQELQGTISCISEKGTGTRFIIVLPVMTRPTP